MALGFCFVPGSVWILPKGGVLCVDEIQLKGSGVRPPGLEESLSQW